MRKSGKLGKISSGCEITTITPFGVWVLVSDHEYFLSHDEYPWFREASVEDVLAVSVPQPGHLWWPNLDVDLHIDSLEHPGRYPLIAAHSKRIERTRKRAAHS